MGRVAKYKKVKTSLKDGFGGGEYVWGSINTQKAKKRSQTSERLRQKRNKKRCKTEEEAISINDDFDLNDLVGSLKKQSAKDQLAQLSGCTMTYKSSVATKSNDNAKPNATVTASQIKVGNQTLNVSIPKSDREERQMVKRLGKSKESGSMEKKAMQKRQEGESMRAFHRRLKDETAMALAADYKQNKHSRTSNKSGKDNGQDNDGVLSKSQRRKDFLNRKKRKKRIRSESQMELPDEEEEVMARRNQGGDVDGFITGEAAIARASFLDQVEQPPTFAQLPRGATKKPNGKVRCKDFESKSNSHTEESIRAEQNAMEAMRRKVQAQYALLKQKRKDQGVSFHL